MKKFALSIGLLLSLSGFQANPHECGRFDFLGKGGSKITIDISKNIFVSAEGKETTLRNCSNETQWCVTNDADFSISTYKKCGAVITMLGHGLAFKNRTVWSLHGDTWFFFEESPSYLFQTHGSLGIVAIYTGADRPFDFRKILRDRTITSESELFNRHELTSNSGLAACAD